MYFKILLIIIIICLISLSIYIVIFQKIFYQWYCQHFFNFDNYLTNSEKKYINFCINLSFLEILRIFHPTYNLIKKLSFFTYSHEINHKNINSGIISYGSTVLNKYLYQNAKKILIQRNIKLPLSLNNNLLFYGLGWDFIKNTFRIYLIFKNFNKLPKKYQNLSYKKNNLLSSGLVAWTYQNNSKLIETKIYRYPKTSPNMKDTYNMAILSSDKRKYVPQYDINYNIKDNNNILKNNINKMGKNILKIYNKFNYKIDTIAYNNKNNFTLYFPKL